MIIGRGHFLEATKGYVTLGGLIFIFQFLLLRAYTGTLKSSIDAKNSMGILLLSTTIGYRYSTLFHEYIMNHNDNREHTSTYGNRSQRA